MNVQYVHLSYRVYIASIGQRHLPIALATTKYSAMKIPKKMKSGLLGIFDKICFSLFKKKNIACSFRVIGCVGIFDIDRNWSKVIEGNRKCSTFSNTPRKKKKNEEKNLVMMHEQPENPTLFFHFVFIFINEYSIIVSYLSYYPAASPYFGVTVDTKTAWKQYLYRLRFSSW